MPFPNSNKIQIFAIFVPRLAFELPDPAAMYSIEKGAVDEAPLIHPNHMGLDRFVDPALQRGLRGGACAV